MKNITSAYREMHKHIIAEESEQDTITEETINEALIVLNNKAYPKFGNVVIMAGGSASGKGFIIDNLLAMEGKKFDVDALKALAMKTVKLKKRILDEFGVDLDQTDLKDYNQTTELHAIMKELGIDDKISHAFANSVINTTPDRKPNLIFDVTLQNLRKLETTCNMVKKWGYKNENIHIVWVITDIVIALESNEKRDRRVRPEMLIDIHEGVSKTMLGILKMGKGLSHYMDGDIIFSFNKIGVDNKVEKSKHTERTMYVTTRDYFTIKKAGEDILGLEEVEESVRKKVASYVPHSEQW